MTPCERIHASLRGERPAAIPFSVYECMLPSSDVLDDYKKRGLAVVHRFSVYDTSYPNCTITTTKLRQNGKNLVRTDIRTPAGDLHNFVEPAGFTSWTHKYLFTDENDYAALSFYLGDAVFTPRYDRADELAAGIDENTILRSNMGLEPLQHLISGGVFGTLNFGYQWMENRDEVIKLYEIMVEKRREIYPIVAASPVLHANYGGNVVPEIVGLEVFRDYYVPNYQEAAEVMHRCGKLIGVHFDANCSLFSEEIAKTDLDYIEAFTPSPDTDMTMREAREAWPDKTLWINYPSSVHLQSVESIEEVTVELCVAVEPGNGFIIGITEDLPKGREDVNYRAILDGIDRYERSRSD